MKRGLYRRLAWSAMGKNRKLYLPYLLTCITMVMMCYILSYLGITPVLSSIRGGVTLQSFLGMGFGVMCVFSLIFLFYTNSFLIRRRKRELGLYHILGMGKRHIALVLLWETVTVAVISLAAGLGLGILLSKAVELGLVRMLGGQGGFLLRVEGGSMLRTALLFGGIFLLLFLSTLTQIHLSRPIELLRSESAGEKPPKANWIGAVVGVILLGGAYYIAVTVQDPVSAVFLFFVAVILVIVATYFLFMAGSVALCRLLQKNPRYYYKTHHFVSVSSMAFRMRRNGAGLASICILCTMVLVMVSSTTCLFLGLEDSLRARFPRHVNLDATLTDLELLSGSQPEGIISLTQEVTAQYGLEQENVLTYSVAGFVGMFEGDVLQMDQSIYSNDLTLMSRLWQIFIVPLDDYNRMMGENVALEGDQVLLYPTKEARYEEDTITLGDNGPTLTVAGQADSFADNGVDTMQIIPSLYLFVPDLKATLSAMGEELIQGQSSLHWYYAFDLACDQETQRAVSGMIRERARDVEIENPDYAYFHVWVDGEAEERGDFYGMYGGFFFLGVLLGVVFLLGAVLIIYYKQITEGYEDQARFLIMEKVGMTKREIRKSINSQVLTVFFLPLLAAGLHLAFAFPIVRKLLLLFGLTNWPFLVLVTVLCYVIFAVIYALVYRATSRAYFHIVSPK